MKMGVMAWNWGPFRPEYIDVMCSWLLKSKKRSQVTVTVVEIEQRRYI